MRGYLGINIENVDADKQAAFKLKSTNGAFVQSVLPANRPRRPG